MATRHKDAGRATLHDDLSPDFAPCLTIITGDSARMRHCDAFIGRIVSFARWFASSLASCEPGGTPSVLVADGPGGTPSVLVADGPGGTPSVLVADGPGGTPSVLAADGPG